MNLNSSKTLPLSVNDLDFYNYFHHGVDFLISGQTHVVRKIIIHSNMVRHVSPLCDLFANPYSLAPRSFSDINDALGSWRANPKMTKTVTCLTFIFLTCVHLSMI